MIIGTYAIGKENGIPFVLENNTTLNDIELLNAVATKELTEGYITLRAREYPPTTEYLDAVVKGDQVAIQAYIEKCLAVKAKYPKP